MPRTLKLSEEERIKWRREQKKRSMQQKRAKLDAAAIEERRQKDRDRYQRKKDNGLITTVHDLPPIEQQHLRKIWREKTKMRRENKKLKKWAEANSQENGSSSTSSFSSVEFTKQTKLVIDALKAQNTLVSLVRKRNSPSPELISSTEPSPAPTSPSTSATVANSETPLPTEPIVVVTINEGTEFETTVEIKQETEF